MEKFRFLLKDVELEQRTVFPKVDPILYQAAGLEANDRQFHLRIPNVANFYSEDGIRVFLNWPEPTEKQTIELFLNGSILGSILHQRNILTLHASSFQFEGKNSVICGNSGFGKSSITLNMCLNHGAQFLTDDLTPIQRGKILPISERMKLWQDTLNDLGVDHGKLLEVWKGMEKYYLPMQADAEAVPPDAIFFGHLHSGPLSIVALSGAEKFQYLLSFQYWEELSNSMLKSREQLFAKMADLCQKTPMFVFQRPENSDIETTSLYLAQFLKTL